MLSSLPVSGLAVIALTAALFIYALILLFSTCGRYRRLQADLSGGRIHDDGFITAVKTDFIAAYRQYGENTNTPAIINNAVAARLHGALMAERFIANAVSLFVTLGLFGTFLGLSLSVSSLTELISLSSTEEWLSILNSVGGGLVSALSGMGVAFYTSLVGVACAIVFTVLRSILNPQGQREKLETMTELWLDHAVAPGIKTEVAHDDIDRLVRLGSDMRAQTLAVQESLSDCAALYERVMNDTTRKLADMIEQSREPIGAFYETVKVFNDNVRDFSAFNYDLRGNIERMDLSFRDFSSAMQKAAHTRGRDERA